MNIVFNNGSLSGKELFDFLNKCDKQFSPLLSSRLNLEYYSQKLIQNAIIINAKMNNEVIGLIAFYTNQSKLRFAFISLICVLQKYYGIGVGSNLMNECVSLAKKQNFRSIQLEVDNNNKGAIIFYEKFGFKVEEKNQQVSTMSKQL